MALVKQSELKRATLVSLNWFHFEIWSLFDSLVSSDTRKGIVLVPLMPGRCHLCDLMLGF